MMVIITGLFQQPQKAFSFFIFCKSIHDFLIPHASFFNAGKRDMTYIPESGPEKSGNIKPATVAGFMFPLKIVPELGPHLQSHVPFPGPVP